MDQKKRHLELMKKRKWALKKLDRAKKALGAGSWHEDSSYELADQDIKLWTQYLADIDKEMEKTR